MKKNILLVLASVLITLGVIGVVGFLSKDPTDGFSLGGDTFDVEPIWWNDYRTTTTLPNSSNGTSATSSFLTADAATSTWKFNCDGASQIDFNLLTIASSTAAKLQWEYAFSDDKALWFYEDGKTIDNTQSVTHGAGPVQHYWTPGTTATSTKNLTIIPTASKYCQIGISVTGANAGIWSELLLRRAY